MVYAGPQGGGFCSRGGGGGSILPNTMNRLCSCVRVRGTILGRGRKEVIGLIDTLGQNWGLLSFGLTADPRNLGSAWALQAKGGQRWDLERLSTVSCLMVRPQ
jgi:hypothetical protein